MRPATRCHWLDRDSKVAQGPGKLLKFVDDSMNGLPDETLARECINIYGTYTLARQAIESAIRRGFLENGSSSYRLTESGRAYLGKHLQDKSS